MQEPDDRKKVPEFHEVFIDIGVGSKAEAEKLVRVGDAVTMDGDVFRLAGERIAARACDNRIGTWSAAEALRHLSAERREVKRAASLRSPRFRRRTAFTVRRWPAIACVPMLRWSWT